MPLGFSGSAGSASVPWAFAAAFLSSGFDQPLLDLQRAVVVDVDVAACGLHLARGRTRHRLRVCSSSSSSCFSSSSRFALEGLGHRHRPRRRRPIASSAASISASNLRLPVEQFLRARPRAAARSRPQRLVTSQSCSGADLDPAPALGHATPRLVGFELLAGQGVQQLRVFEIDALAEQVGLGSAPRRLCRPPARRNCASLSLASIIVASVSSARIEWAFLLSHRQRLIDGHLPLRGRRSP